MRKIAIIIVIFIFFNLENYGQESKKLSFQFDIGTSITLPYQSEVEFWTFTAIDGSNKTSYKSDYGYFIETLLTYKLKEKISLTSGLNYNYISYQIIDGYEGFLSEGSLNNSYLSIPLKLNYRISKKIPISISAGAYIGFIMFAQEKGTRYMDTSMFVALDPNDPLLQPEQDYDNNIKEDYSSIDYGLLFQLDYELSFNEKISGVIFSRFNYGLKDIYSGNNKSAIHNSAFKWKNYNILIGMGIKI